MTGTTQQMLDEDGNRQGGPTAPAVSHTPRFKSEDLFQQQREVEIDHQGRIYRLRLTQLNKLILTA